MTTVVIRLAVPSATVDPDRPAWCAADETPAEGKVRFAPYQRRHVEGVADDRIVLEASIEVTLVDGYATIDLEPTNPATLPAWKVWEKTPHGIERVVLVPAVESVDYGDLVDVNPATLAPTAEPDAEWWAAWDAMAAGTYLVPDPVYPGLYIMTKGSTLTPDPDYPGLYSIGSL